VGIMSDISGSMGTSVDPVSSSAWILHEASSRIEAKVASVLFGSRATVLLEPGKRATRVPVWSAHDGYEAFKDGFLAIDAMLDIVDAPGAKMLFVVTDSQFVNEGHAAYAHTAMKMCKQNDVAVFWLNFDGDEYDQGYMTYGHGEKINVTDHSPQAVANLVGNKVIDTYRRLKPR
jgi:hypothetical protein